MDQCFPGNATFSGDTFNYIDPRTGFFSYAYSTSPGMAATMVNVGAKYPTTYKDANGEFLMGDKHYQLHLPKDVPAALFWSVTAYDSLTASGLDNGQPFPSINTMDKPAINADGSTDIYFGPEAPANGTKNWIRTVQGKGFFVILGCMDLSNGFSIKRGYQATLKRWWSFGDRKMEKIAFKICSKLGA